MRRHGREDGVSRPDAHRPPGRIAEAFRARRARGEAALVPYVCAGFPLEQAVQAMQMLENRDVVGKCVVTMNGYRIDT
jgi:hypothetical protein